ncbi:hypothetical protein scyTo_0022067 [Scyliorhinus torazame]|uniref:ZP domain-containing protein n=1 Tax=Scyliorhinus torazame TaxID=75743 RepID=A0A401QBD5_SCYTO|nr:hypothetical protein [Scyliorhinus torazame]
MNVSFFPSDNVVQSVVNVVLPEGAGTYEVVMIMYRDPQYQETFTQTPVTLSVNDRVYIGIRASGIDPDQFVLTLDNCWTTPVSNPSSQTRWSLISNQCPNTLSEVQIAESGISPIGRFSFAVFKFVGDVNQLYLHCQIQLCNFQTTRCSASCPAGRNIRPRSQTDVLTGGPFHTGPAVVDTVNSAEVSDSSQQISVSTVTIICFFLSALLLQ